jgi:DNA-binding MarR family transcriptional regulator
MNQTKHPHNNVINNLEEINTLISLLETSKMAYLKANLSIHLHESEIKLFKQVIKHDKKHHINLRIKRYQKLMENPDQIPELYELHLKLFLKRYKKLEKKGIIEVIEEPDNGLPYDFVITDKGQELIQEIKEKELAWEEEISEELEDKEELLKLLKQIAIPAMQISYSLKKQQKGVY